MKVVILSGGKGLRLKEHDDSPPKAINKIKGKPLIEYTLEHFTSQGYNDFIVCLGYKGDDIIKHFKNKKKFNIKFVQTSSELGTAQRLKFIENMVNDNFFLTYCDNIYDVNLQDMERKHNGFLTAMIVPFQSDYGIMTVGKNEIINSFVEKPKINDLWVNGGCYILNYRILKNIGREQSFEKEILPNLFNTIETVGFKHIGKWYSINTLKDLKKAEEDLSE